LKEYSEALAIAERVARSVRDAVRPLLDDPEAGQTAGVAASGDTTFSMDIAAEEALKRAVESAGCPLACYSEDEGLKVFGSDPRWLLIVDPVDGTRPAAAGFEACAVSVAVAHFRKDACCSDVVAGAVYEVRRDRLYRASRGNGAEGIFDGRTFRLAPAAPPDVRHLRWTLEVVSRPSELNFAAAGPLIDATTLRGGFFVLNSSAFSLCQVAAGRLSGMADLSGRLVADFPDRAELFAELGHGRPMGLWAYDIAAAALIAQEAGCTVTDAYGRPLDGIRLTRTRDEDMASCICAASEQLHAEMMRLLERGLASLR
jgi:myo-inositol-1(or 4)-monophosphatase